MGRMFVRNSHYIKSAPEREILKKASAFFAKEMS